MLRLGVVGCGRVTTMFHLKAIKAVEEVDLVAVVDRHRPSMENAKNACGADKGYVDYEELLSDHDVEAVVVNTPPMLHEEMVIQALKAGKHVLCEKPLATSVEGCLRVKEAQSDTGLVVLPIHNYVFTPILEVVKDQVHEGIVGSVRKVSVSFDNNLKSYRSKTDFRLKNNFGIVEDILPHMLSVTQSLVGSATTIESIKAWKKSFNVIDNISMTLKTEEDVPFDFSFSWTKLIPKFSVEVSGSSGSIRMDLVRSPFACTLESNGVKKKIGENKGVGVYADLLRFKHPSFERQYRHFCALVKGTEAPKITIDDEISIVGMIEKVERYLSPSEKP